jgi:carboxyl-terminal processing protease
VIVPSVESRLLERDIAYVRLKSFQEGSYVELIEQIAGLRRKARLTGVILDLRGNPGGLVSEAVAIADEMLDHGVIYSARHRGRVVETVVSQTGDLLEKLPLVVLVGAGTASSAEILSGALQDRGRATLVGEPTFGKGSVQNVIELSGGAGLLLTTLRYFTPKGRAIQARGLIPNVLVRTDDTRPVLREADISGHLHGEGVDSGAVDAMTAQAAIPEARITTKEPRPAEPKESTSDVLEPKLDDAVLSDATTEATSNSEANGRAPKRFAPERTPIATLLPDPTQGPDPVLARGYSLLCEQAVGGAKGR